MSIVFFDFLPFFLGQKGQKQSILRFFECFVLFSQKFMANFAKCQRIIFSKINKKKKGNHCWLPHI